MPPVVLALAGLGAAVAALYAYRTAAYLLLQVTDALRYACHGPTSLSGKLYVVTGGSDGIGAATAAALAKKGASVVVVARRAEKLESVREQCVQAGATGKILPYPCDMTDGKQVAELGEKVIAAHGVPDGLVCCAAFGAWGYVVAQSHADIDRGVQAPLVAAAHAVRAFAPAMLEDVEARRQIVIPMSPVAFFSWPAATMYSANRAGLLGFAKALKQDLYGTHVQVKLATFGETDTGYWAAHPDSRQHVPWISLTGLIPTLSSEFVGERITRQIVLRRGDMTENFEIAILTELMHVCPGVVEWVMRWFCEEVPGLGKKKGHAVTGEPLLEMAEKKR